MTTSNADFKGDGGERVKRVYDKEQPRLRRYFLRHAGDPSEADDYVGETFARLLAFMEGRVWEREEDYIPAYLMRFAGVLCLEKLAEKKSRGETFPAGAGPGTYPTGLIR